MNFFISLHRSMLDPQFYTEVLGYKRIKVFLFLLFLLIMTSAVTVAAQWWYQIESNDGFPPSIEKAFKGMEIKNGILDPHVQTPFVPPVNDIWPLMSELFFQNGMVQAKDSLIFIDTTATQKFAIKAPFIGLAKDRVVFNYDDKYLKATIPYAVLLSGEKNLKFTAVEIRNLLKRPSIMPTMIFSMFMVNMLQSTVTILFSILFLAVAAYIFRIERVAVFSSFLRASSFAITPMALGLMLIEVAGVNVLWGWHLLIFISTIILFRGMVAIGKASPINVSEEEKL